MVFDSLYYKALLEKREERDQRLKKMDDEIRNIKAAIAQTYDAPFPDSSLDEAIELQRELAGKLVPQVGDKSEDAVVEIDRYETENWEVTDAAALAEGLKLANRTGLIKFGFEKKQLNTYLDGCRMAGFGVPAGVDTRKSEIVRIKIKKNAS